jgi:hypothetical protein
VSNEADLCFARPVYHDNVYLPRGSTTGSQAASMHWAGRLGDERARQGRVGKSHAELVADGASASRPARTREVLGMERGDGGKNQDGGLASFPAVVLRVVRSLAV